MPRDAAAGFDQAGQFAQLAGVGPDHEVHAAYVGPACVAGVWLLGDRNQGAPAAQQGPGPGGGVAAYRVHGDVHVTNVILEPARVVQDLVGPEPGDEGVIAGRGGGGDPGAVQGGALYDALYRAGGAGDAAAWHGAC